MDIGPLALYGPSHELLIESNMFPYRYFSPESMQERQLNEDLDRQGTNFDVQDANQVEIVVCVEILRRAQSIVATT